MEEIPVKSLNEEIAMTQLEDYVTTFDSKMSKQLKKDKKALIKALVPFIIGVILTLITKNLLFISIGTFSFGTAAIIKNIKDDIEHDKNFNRYLNNIGNNNSKVISLENDEPIDLFVRKGRIITKNNSDFYTPEYKDFIEEQKEFIEDKVDKSKSGKEDISIDELELCKDDTMKRIVYEYEIYCTAYNLPPMTITVKEWDALFEVMYNKLKEKGIENELYKYMSFLQRYTFAYALLHNQQSINIYSFLNQMHMFEKVGFTKLNIDSIISEVNQKLNIKDKKVIKFSKIYPSKK